MDNQHVRSALVAAVLVLLVAPVAGARDTAVNRPLLGMRGDAARFKAQTGQDSVVRHAFVGWEQGQAWGSPFRELFRTLTPIPMIHIGTAAKPPGQREAITPLAIAQGKGDAYLEAMRAAITEWGRLIYVRPMAEMNHPVNLYSYFRKRDAAHAPSAYRAAFCRIYRILHKGNPTSRLIVIWNPLAGLDRGAGPPAQEFYPGDGCVDWVGNDIFASQVGVASWAANDRLYSAHPRKPYSFPEWGLEGVDDPGFVEKLCQFAKTHPRVKLLAYFESKPGSRYDLGDKPKSRDAYRKCVTPIGAPASPLPQLPGTAVIKPLPAGQLRLTADPATGAAPLDVTFTLESGIDKVARWQLVFGDGELAQGNGEPPSTVDHAYAKDGVYNATLIVFQAPPFTGTAIRFLTSAKVEVGDEPGTLLALRPTPSSGKAPLAVSFRVIANPPSPIVRWQLLYGDGQQREGTGKPPGFLGYTYKAKGAYRAVLIVYLGPPFTGTVVRFLTFADVRVS
jgi:PKD repeat protein